MVLLLNFSKSAWPIVGKDVMQAVLSYFETCEMFSPFNSTAMTLVPKCPNADEVKMYRPISCCSVVYKCITKVIVNRLKPILSTVISPNQSAFVPGRSITDNILLAHELVRGYGLKLYLLGVQ